MTKPEFLQLLDTTLTVLVVLWAVAMAVAVGMVVRDRRAQKRRVQQLGPRPPRWE